jgi:hypothetical protein
MTLMTETDDEELPVSQETIEKAIGVVHEYVAELRERARYRPARDDHHDGPATMPTSLARRDPQHTARMHRLTIGCDAFIDTMGG